MQVFVFVTIFISTTLHSKVAKHSLIKGAFTKNPHSGVRGSKNINFKTAEEKIYTGPQQLAEHLTLSWRIKPTNGYFFRAESFFYVANYLDYINKECGGGTYTAYGGKSLHAQSHGESFLSFFQNRLGSHGFFIFDEPEAALSPQRQLALLRIIHEACKNPDSQFIIATHSPLLLAILMQLFILLIQIY
jgi:predicted ATPase